MSRLIATPPGRCEDRSHDLLGSISREQPSLARIAEPSVAY
jgi:hypothetical protein